jgi:hypothetical protein
MYMHSHTLNRHVTEIKNYELEMAETKNRIKMSEQHNKKFFLKIVFILSIFQFQIPNAQKILNKRNVHPTLEKTFTKSTHHVA